MNVTTEQIRVVLFDLGGVLVEMTGVARMISWMDGRVTPEQLWAMWLSSPTVRNFERGLCDRYSFSEAVIEEMALPVDREAFLTEFASWSSGLFPGAIELVNEIRPEYTKATLCNTNEIHWPRMMGELGLAGLFHHEFASHLTGKIKPDRDAFSQVVEVLNQEPGAVLFIDDNELNVEAAQDVGMKAVRVRGIAEARAALVSAGVLG